MGIQDLIIILWQKAGDFVVPVIAALVRLFVGSILVNIVSARIKAKVLEGELEDNVYTEKISNIVGLIVTYVGQTFNVLIAFQIIGLDVGILMAGVSFGIGFAMQEVLENLFAGVLIVSNPMLKVGETIQLLGDLNQFGFIDKLQSRYTVVRLFTGRKLIVPNTVLVNTAIKTFKRENVIRGAVTFETGFSAPIEFVQKIIREAVNEHPNLIEKERTSVVVKAVNERGVNYVVYFFYSPSAGGRSGLMIKSDLRKTILKTIYKHDIKFLYQIQVTDFEKGPMP